jgi:hypothetical protein
MSDHHVPSAADTSNALSDLIKTVIKEVCDAVVPIIKNCQTAIEELVARVDSIESLVLAQHAQAEAFVSKIKQLQSDCGLVRLEIQKLQYQADIRQCKQLAGNVCAFPVKKPPPSARNPADPENLLQTLASEVPEVTCAIKPFKSGGFKVSFQASASSTAQQSAAKAIAAAPTFLARHGVAVTQDLPVSLRTVRKKVQSFVTELRRTPRFSNFKIELLHGHVKVNDKQLGPEYLWPNAISAGKDELLELIELSQFCTCSNWEKGLLHDDHVRLNLKHFAGSAQVLMT